MQTRSLVLLMFIVSLLMTGSCRSGRDSRMQRQAYKMEKQATKDSEKLVEEYKQHHYDIQAEETQEMIKKSRKKNKELKRKSRGSFIDRVFRRDRSKNCYGN